MCGLLISLHMSIWASGIIMLPILGTDSILLFWPWVPAGISWFFFSLSSNLDLYSTPHLLNTCIHLLYLSHLLRSSLLSLTQHRSSPLSSIHPSIHPSVHRLSPQAVAHWGAFVIIQATPCLKGPVSFLFCLLELLNFPQTPFGNEARSLHTGKKACKKCFLTFKEYVTVHV